MRCVQARKIRNAAVINEHASVPVIRALRAEVAFLKQQLAVAGDGVQVRSPAGEARAGDPPRPSAAVQNSREGVASGGAQAVDLGASEGAWAAGLGAIVECERAAASGKPGRGEEHHASGLQGGGDAPLGDARGVDGISGGGERLDGAYTVDERGRSVGVAGSWRGGCEEGEVRGSSGRQCVGVGQGPQAGGGGGGGDEQELAEGKAVTRELVGKIVQYADVVRGLQQTHSKALQAHGELRRRFVAAEADLRVARDGLARSEQENLELRELGTLLAAAAKVCPGRVRPLERSDGCRGVRLPPR